MSRPVQFANTLRARPGTIVVAEGDDAITIRVQAAEAWDAVRVRCRPSSTVAEVKQAAMHALLPDIDALDEYAVKLRGALIAHESVTLADAGVRDASTLFVAARRRHPIL